MLDFVGFRQYLDMTGYQPHSEARGGGETDRIRYRMKVFAKLSKTFKGQSTCKLHCIRKFFKTLSSRNVSWICILKKLKTYWDNDSAIWEGNIHNADSDKDIFWWLNQTNLFWPILQLNNVLHFDHIEIPRIILFDKMFHNMPFTRIQFEYYNFVAIFSNMGK